MIEIKSRDGQVLYTAQSATDVRAALEEAARADADLRGANPSSVHTGGRTSLSPRPSVDLTASS